MKNSASSITNQTGLPRHPGHATFCRADPLGSQQQHATTSNREFAMKKALYSLAVLMRIARADKLSAPYIYY
ncbi:cittilin family RiPP precursor [Myxococcus llanfairpwllgwyngyllgogerychwyrndrobwllllantysiliogogogochensis]|uniref:cittilin family RiPP precursor n=1 Tax=Myxococcus TaxID=32 RepID=UPI001C2D93E9